MKILIIGGTGIISTPLTDLLIARGDDVTLYNRGSTPSRVQAVVHTVQGDRQRYAEFEAQMHAGPRYDCVIDMVAYAPEDAASAVRAFAGRIGQYLFCSTVDVYQKPATRLPYTEREPYGGLNPYGRNKVVCERTVLAAHSRGDFPVTIIRPAYTYGEGRPLLHTTGSWANYTARLLYGQPIIVPGDGTSLWVCCHAEDVARAFAAAIGNPRAYGRAYHTTGEEWLTWNQYHTIAASALGAPPPRLVHIPTDLLAQLTPQRLVSVLDNFQFNNVFDNTAARTDLGFRPAISWHEGVRRVGAWLAQNPQPRSLEDDALDERVLRAWHAAEQVAKAAFASRPS